jgi:hypothetical protein
MKYKSLFCIIMNIMLIKTSISERRKLTSCEGSSLSLTCEAGTVINIIRANFGRFSKSVCPSESRDNTWSTCCIQPTSLRVVNGLCGEKSSCSVPVSSSQFGDPCPETPKYLELVFTCVPSMKILRHKSLMPPWLLAMEATESSDSVISSSPPTTSTTKSTFLRSPSEEFLRYLKRKQERKTSTEVKSNTKDMTKVFVNVAKVHEEALQITYEEDTTVIVAASVSLVCCIAIIMLSIIIIRMKKMQGLKSQTNLYKISTSDDQYLQNQYQYVSKTNTDYTYIDEKSIQDVFVEKTVQNIYQKRVPETTKSLRSPYSTAQYHIHSNKNRIGVHNPGLSHIEVSHI